jgi:hypothetical protein
VKNGKIKQVLSGDWCQWEEEDTRKGNRKVNVVETLHTHVGKWKKETRWNYSSNMGRRDKGE